jgi:hypothetical protein
VALLGGRVALRVEAAAAVSAVEDAIRADPAWQAGIRWGEPRFGHPEGSIADHIEEVLANVDRCAGDDAQRERLRVIALVHDTFKGDVRFWTRDHARLARRFAERFTDDAGVLQVTANHDDAYRAWRFGHRTGLWFVARWRVRRLLRRLGPHLELFRAFYRCDNETGDKKPDDRLWFEGLLAR